MRHRFPRRARPAPSRGRVSPADAGSILCDGEICVQRTTSVVNGKATVELWANTSNFTGTLTLTGAAENFFGTSPTKLGVAGGAGKNYSNVPVGTDYIAWGEDTKGNEVGQKYFAAGCPVSGGCLPFGYAECSRLPPVLAAIGPITGHDVISPGLG